MVYANYTPAKLPTVLTDLDRKIQAVVNLDTLDIIGKVLYNAAVSPSEPKYRKLRLGNDKVKAAIVDVAGGLDLLLALGWALDEAEDALIIPPGKFMSMKEVRLIEEQKDRARKHARTSEAEAIRRAAAGTAQQA